MALDAFLPLTPAPSWPESLAPRALPNAARRRARHERAGRVLLVGLALGGVLWLAGCPNSSQASHAGPVATLEARARVQELVDVLTPLKETVTSDLTDKRYLRQLKLRGELERAGPEVGRAALVMLGESDPKRKIVDVERGLLQVAARAAPLDTAPLLETLTTEYGASLELRTEATLLFAEVAPARAVVVLESYVSKTRVSKTMAPSEFVVRAWVTCCEKTKRNPVPELADVATNIFLDTATRTLAIEELGKRTDQLGLQALRTILVESTGDGYLRRKAAQGLRDRLPAEESCVMFRKVADREVDLNMLKFLADMIEKNCPQ